MKGRVNSVLISSVLFTIALLCFWPRALGDVLAGHDKSVLANLDAGVQMAIKASADRGVADLAIILIGLLITWTGYFRRVGWAWFAMLIVVCAWAFPLFMLPYLPIRIDISEWVYGAIHQSGLLRSAARDVLLFILMVIALVLPIRSFFFPCKPGAQGPSPKLVIGSAVTIAVLAIAFLAYAHLRVYEIQDPTHFLTEPPPPPPPPYTGY